MIRLHNVTKVYPCGHRALCDVTLSVEKARLVFLTGPSGAGKTTLLKLILGVEKPTSGQIFVGNVNVEKLRRSSVPYFRRNLGVLFQDFKLIPTRTALENVAAALEVEGRPRSEVRRRSRAALRGVGLHGKFDLFPDELSGGEQQRVALARAMVRNPSVLLADEPTGNLDAENALGLVELFRRITVHGVTVLIATHDEGLIRAMPRRVLRLREGRLHECL
ncbi:MAG: cell division ATP-binding protein FtsE [Deltaproteobacteria bacterium]|nr:MAG: cell division ATP-binding protein FtsE [Deltaproteobacteria bacterium]